jgi:3-dehydroshikimate dehydratase
MIRLSAFADEISANLDEQNTVLRSENIHFIDLRGVWYTNVLDLTDQQVTEIKQKLDAHDIRISAIVSPIGKIPIDTPFGEHRSFSSELSHWLNSLKRLLFASFLFIHLL